MNDDSDMMHPAPSPETVADDPSLGEAPLYTGNTISTRDELWQVQSDPKAAREVAARHLARLMYTMSDSWSRYIFHENDPQA